MPTSDKSIYLVGGSDEYSIKEHAARLAEKLAPKAGGEFATEIIEGVAGNQDEALKIIHRVHEALEAVSLFGDAKLVWLKNTNLLADERGVLAEAVKEALADFGERLKRGMPAGVTLLISAIGCHRGKSLYKTLAKLGEVQFFEALEEGKDADEAIAAFVRGRLREEKKTLTGAGFQLFREIVAPNLREVANELEKLCLYAGKRAEITDVDVRAICSVSRQAVIWELTDALGSRSVRRSLTALDNLLGSGEEPLGIVAMLAAQFRLKLLMKDLMNRKQIAVGDEAFRFVKAFEDLPERETGHFPKTKEGKPPSPWRLYRCAVAAKNFSLGELLAAMDLVMQANVRLVSTQIDERLVLEEVIVKIAGPRDIVSQTQSNPTGGSR